MPELDARSRDLHISGCGDLGLEREMELRLTRR